MIIQYLDRPPPGWFVLAVNSSAEGSRNWTALLVDVHPNADRFRRWPPREAWFRVPGEHNNRNAAWEALEDVMTTWH